MSDKTKEMSDAGEWTDEEVVERLEQTATDLQRMNIPGSGYDQKLLREAARRLRKRGVEREIRLALIQLKGEPENHNIENARKLLRSTLSVPDPTPKREREPGCNNCVEGVTCACGERSCPIEDVGHAPVYCDCHPKAGQFVNVFGTTPKPEREDMKCPYCEYTCEKNEAVPDNRPTGDVGCPVCWEGGHGAWEPMKLVPPAPQASEGERHPWWRYRDALKDLWVLASDCPHCLNEAEVDQAFDLLRSTPDDGSKWREMLERYGSHHPDCYWLDKGDPSAGCNCGWQQQVQIHGLDVRLQDPPLERDPDEGSEPVAPSPRQRYLDYAEYMDSLADRIEEGRDTLDEDPQALRSMADHMREIDALYAPKEEGDA